MTFPAARMGDKCSGHPPYKPRTSVQGSPNVFFNSKPAHRKYDKWAIHCSKGNCHPGIAISGSPTVFTNGLSQTRVTDKINCKSIIATGSPNIFVGGGVVSYTPQPMNLMNSLPQMPSNPLTGPFGARTLSMVLGTNSEHYRYSESIGWSYGPYSMNSNSMKLFLEYLKEKDDPQYVALNDAGGLDGSVLGSVEFQMVWDDLSSNPSFLKHQEDFKNDYQYMSLYHSLKTEGIIVPEKLHPVIKLVIDDMGPRTDIFINTYSDDVDTWLSNLHKEITMRLPNGLLKNYQDMEPKDQFKKFIELNDFFDNLKES